MTDIDWASLPSLIVAGSDLAGLCMLTALLVASAWCCLSPPPTLRHLAPSAGQQHGILLALCALTAPLLMFASLAGGLALTQQAGTAAAPSHPAPLLVWCLYAAIGLAQLFALQRLAYWPAPIMRRLLPLAASALLLLPLATALALMALAHRYLALDSMPHIAIAVAAGAAVSGILLWLPVQWLSCVPADAALARSEPVMAPAEPAAAQAAMEPTAAATSAARSSAEEMEARLREIAALLEQEQHADEQQQRAKDEIQYASAMRQQVNSQKFLFESGLPCNLAMLVNGLILLDLPLDIHDHVRGDTLLHAAVREGDAALVRHLLDHGASISAVNWAGLNARAGTQDAAMQALLDAAETTER